MQVDEPAQQAHCQAHLVHRLQLLICHKLDGIKGQVSQEERSIAGKKALHALPLQNVPDRDCSTSKLPCVALPPSMDVLLLCIALCGSELSPMPGHWSVSPISLNVMLWDARSKAAVLLFWMAWHLTAVKSPQESQAMLAQATHHSACAA